MFVTIIWFPDNNDLPPTPPDQVSGAVHDSGFVAYALVSTVIEPYRILSIYERVPLSSYRYTGKYFRDYITLGGNNNRRE